MPATMIHHVCSLCNKQYSVSKSRDWIAVSRKAQNRFCSIECKQEWFSKQSKLIHSSCSQCNKQVCKKYNAVRKNKTGRFFCSKSCAATYNNTHKTHGIRRSKLEIYLERKLREKYPKLDMDFNQKKAINSELDIHIPSLNLAFELNGIYHYEPIHGQSKLSAVQNNDKRKFQACLERDIDLCIINSSSLGYFKEEKAKTFLDIILSIISTKMRSK